MKSVHVLPPVVALLIVGAGMGYERWGLDRLEAENGVLQNHAAAEIRVEETPEALFPKVDHSRKVNPGISGGKCDWVAVAAMVDGQMDNNLDPRAWREFQKQIAGMNEEELLAASEEILALDVPVVTRQTMLNLFTSRLAGMNSELALRRLFGRTGTDAIFTNAWESWLKKDARAAATWFDEQIAAGKTQGKRLDGSDASRPEFERSLIHALFESDPAAAVRRLAKLPEEMLVVVGGTFRLSGINEAAQKALADVYRSQLSGKESAEKLAAGMLAWEDNDDFSKDAAYLERIAVTPAERAVCVKRVVENRCVSWAGCGTMSIARIEALRTWMDGQSPGLTANLTQQVIGVLARNDPQSKMGLEQVEEIAAHYQALNGGNEMLADALSRCVGGNYRKEYVAALVARLPDERQRAEILEKLGSH